MTANGIETLNITSTNAGSGTLLTHSLTFVGSSIGTISVGGTAALTLVDTDTTITNVDASALSVDNATGKAGSEGLTWTAGATTGALTIHGSATGGDVINASDALGAVAITVSAGVNAVTGSATAANTITGGTGADTIIGGTGADTIVGGGGADVITAGAGADKITVSGTTWNLNQGTADSGANSTLSSATYESTTGFDVVHGVQAGGTITLTGNTGLATVTDATDLAHGTDAVFARGTYDANVHRFVYDAHGSDTALTYDVDGSATTYDTIILVGFHNTASTATAGVITLA